MKTIFALEAPQRTKLVDQFFERARVRSENECWPWNRSLTLSGYGRLKSQGYTWRAHRLSYELFKGPIPEGMLVMHACDNPECVNPSHLSVGTHADNNADKAKKGRAVSGEKHHSRTNPECLLRGEKHGRTSLTREDVIEMRCLAREGVADKALAELYGISASQAWRIVKGKFWQHLNDEAPPVTRDRHVRGAAVPTAKIDTEGARLALALSEKGWSNRRIADAIRQDIRLVRHIVQRKTWKHVVPFPQPNAESMTFRRACARFGLGLYEGDPSAAGG